MNIKTMPKDVAAEMLRYLSEHENFKSLDDIGDDVNNVSIKALLREISDELAREVAADNKIAYDVKGCKKLSKEAKNIISCLSPREEKALLSAFGLLEKK